METNKFIPLASPDIRDTDIERVNRVLRSGMLIQGSEVGGLEAEFSAVAGTRAAIAVSNGTATMHLVLKALGIKEGDEVIVPAFSYVATANVVELVGATPVFVDIEERTFNINVTKIEEQINSKTKAIIPVHEFGLACDIKAVMQIAQKHQLPVIEDAACALGAQQEGRRVGSFGIAGSFSLHPRKSITCGEGGVITLNDPALEKKIRQLRNHGIEMEEGKMIFEEAGFNYRMTDFQAALAASQMERLEAILKKKQELSEVYFNELRNEKISLPVVPGDRNHTWQTFHVVLAGGINQQQTIQELRQQGIGTNYGAQCIPAQAYYQRKYGHHSQNNYPNSWRAYSQGLALPLYEKLTKEDIQSISKIINKI